MLQKKPWDMDYARGAKPRVLVVEDSFILALDTEQQVTDLDCTVVGPVATVAAAMPLLEDGKIDGAVLDINLGDEQVWPLAQKLADAGIPFVLLTGYTGNIVPDRLAGTPVLFKPLDTAKLRAALRNLRLKGS